MIIAVDHGNSAIKTEHYAFPSALEKHANRPPMASDILEYDGAFWTMSGQRIPYMMDKSKDDRFFVLTLIAAAKEMFHNGYIPPGTDVDLAVGLPPAHFALMREQFTQYLKRGEVKFSFNEAPTTINIKNVFVYPQAYAAVVPQGTRLKEEPRIFIIDIGGLTTDVLLLKNSVPDLHFCRSFENGIIPMTNLIIGKIGAQHGIKISEDQITAAIKGDRRLVLSEDVIKDILSYAKQHADMILDELRENMVELKANPVIFIGGGAILLKSCLENSSMIVKADFVLDEKANAIGYALLASHQLKKSLI
jgi:plasmid segregation protein ParM